MNPNSTRPARPPKLKERLRETTRAAILDAAERVYVKHGLEGGRMEQVAVEAGVSVGTLYNYFADRKALVTSLLETHKAEMLHRIDESLRDAPADPIERLRALVLASLEHLEAHRPLVSLLVQEGVALGSPVVPGTLQPTPAVRGLQTRARAALELAREQGRLDDTDLDFLAHLFTGLLRAAILFGLTERSSLDPRESTERIMRCFCDGAGLR